MLLDDRPSHPMVIVARFDFTGGRPPAGLADGFAATVADEPLLAARIATPRRGRPRWLAAQEPCLTWAATTAADPPQASLASPLRRLDPATGPMMHAEVVPTDAGWSIVVAVHHAACDGLGLVGFMERWLLRVAGMEQKRSRTPADRMALLRGRGRVGGSWPEFLRMLPRLSKGLEGVKQFVSHDVATLGSPYEAGCADAAAGPWRPAVITTTLDADDVRRLDERATRQGVMVNDLLMAALTATIGGILDADTTRRQPGRWIRLATPMSLRTKSDYALPAANRVSMVFMDRQPADRCDEAGLQQSFKTEMDVIRSHSLGHIFPMSLEAGRWLPGGLDRSTRRPKPQATAVLSNLGRCFHRSPLAGADGEVTLGENRLARWWIVPPVRPGTALAAATHETGGRREITFHVDASSVCLGEARGWLDAMKSTLLESTAGECLVERIST